MNKQLGDYACTTCAHSMVSHSRPGYWICAHENSKWKPRTPQEHPVYMLEPLEECIDFEDFEVVQKRSKKKL